MSQIQTVRTPTGQLPLIRQTAERLLAEGVISGTIDGDLHANDAATVKAAILAASVCDFCSSPGATHHFDVPDFGVSTAPGNYSASRSTGGWMACDACDALIRADKRKSLLDRAVDNHAFPKFSRRAVEDLYAKFWQGMDDRAEAAGGGAAIADYIEDRFPRSVGRPKLTDRDERLDAVMRVTGLSRPEVDALLAGRMPRELIPRVNAFSRQWVDQHRTTAAFEAALEGPRKPLADVVPHWQRALDMRFNALAFLQEAIAKQASRASYLPEAVDLDDPAAVRAVVEKAHAKRTLADMGFGTDVRLLKAAQAYSFNGETIAAIREAARGIPHDAPLSSIETPNTGAGWFWFGEPLPLTASPIAAERVDALLWGWTDEPGVEYEVTITDEVCARLPEQDQARLAEIGARANDSVVSARDLPEVQRMLRAAGVSQREFDAMTTRTSVRPLISFTAYVVDMSAGATQGRMIPSTRWTWGLDSSFHDMIARSAVMWDESYGPSSVFGGESGLVSREETLKTVGELSKFFVMACLWFKQTVPVLTRDPGHVERHARKRYVRDHKLDEAPSVQVVALRRSLRVAVADAPEAQREGAKAYSCRWVVKGHPRLQACGPGRRDRKLIWIEAHVAGPDDKPLRTREKVFAVIR